MNNSIMELNEVNLEQKVPGAAKPVRADFWATWPELCKAMVPLIESVARDLDGSVKESRVSAEQDEDLTGRYGVVGQGNVLVSFKAHDLPNKELSGAIRRGVKSFARFDPEGFQDRAAIQGRVVVVAVPQTQTNHITSPAFIEEMRELTEQTNVISIIRPVQHWIGKFGY